MLLHNLLASEYFKALETKLARAWSIRLGSTVASTGFGASSTSWCWHTLPRSLMYQKRTGLLVLAHADNTPYLPLTM